MYRECVVTLSILAALFPTPLGKRAQGLCQSLRSQGWRWPTDNRGNSTGPAEWNDGQLYRCSLERPLVKGEKGRHAPVSLDLQVTSDSRGDAVLLGANICCEPSRAMAIKALAKQAATSVGGIPVEVSDAIRAAKSYTLIKDGVTYTVTPNPGYFGMLMRLEVEIKSPAPNPSP